MAEDLINSFIDTDAAGKQINDTIANLELLQKQLLDTADSAITLNNAIGKSNTNTQLKNNTTAVTTELGKLERQIVQVNTQQQKATVASQARVAALNKEYTAYQQLNNSLALAEQKARELGATLGVTSKEYITASASVNKLRDEVNAIDKPLNTFTNNTDRYTKGIAGFFGSAFSKIRFLANVIPNFGIGTFFLLLGTGIVKATEALGLFNNKISDTQKNLTNLNDVFKAANKEGADQATNLKILYAAATDVNNSYADRIRAAQELKKEFPGTYKNDSDLAIISGELSAQTQQLTKDIYENAKARAAASKISELAAQQLDIDFQKQKIINQKQADIANVKPIKTIGGGAAGGVDVLPTFADPATQKKSITDQQQTLKDLLRGELEQQDLKRKSLQNQIDFLTKFAGGNNKIAKALSSDNTGTEKQKDPKAVLEEQLKAIKLAEDAILQSDTASYDDRTAAVDLFYNKSYDLIKQASDKQILTQLETSNKLTELDAVTAKQRIQINKDAIAAITKAFQQGASEQFKIEQQQIDDFKDKQNERLLQIDKDKSDTLAALADQYSAGKISASDYNQAVYDIDVQSSQDRIQLQIDTIQKIIDKQKEFLAFGIGTDKELQKSQDDLTKLEIQKADEVTKAKLKGIADVIGARKALADLEKQAADQALDLVKTIVEGGYQRQLEALQAQSDQINTNADQEKAAVERSLLTDQQKADKEKLIDAQTAQRQEALTKQENKIKHDQAVFEKAISAIKIVEATAIAEVQALTYLSNPLTAPFYPAIAATIGALGALELATLLAQPIPKYKDGTGYHKGGYALFGEAGTEIVLEPNKPAYLTEGATVSNLPTGTKVISNAELMAAMANPGSSKWVSNQLDLSELLQQNDRNNEKLIRALSTKQRDTYRAGVRDGAKRSEYLKRNLN